jgi:ABC-type branched-subunit amino acid transport system substrate-binding protein
VPRRRHGGARAQALPVVIAGRLAALGEPMKRGGAKTKSLMLDALESALRANRVATVVGELAFDVKGDVKAPRFDLYVWRNGKYEPATETRCQKPEGISGFWLLTSAF